MYTYLECVRCGNVDALTPAEVELVDRNKDYLCYPCESTLSALDTYFQDCCVCGAEEAVRFYGFSQTVYCRECGQRYDVERGEHNELELEPYFGFSEPAVVAARVICELAGCRFGGIGWKAVAALRRLFRKDVEAAALFIESLKEIGEEAEIHDNYIEALKGAKKRL